MGRTLERAEAIRFSETTENERMALTGEETDELGRLGLDVSGASYRTSRALRMSEWHYLDADDLARAIVRYRERLAYVTEQVETGILTGARARRAVRCAEHALTVAERQTIDTVEREDDTDYDADAVLDVESTEYVRPTAEQVIIASRNPMGVASWSLALEHAATEYLHAHGIRTTSRPDVWSKRHKTHLAMADKVAYKGAVRYVQPKPCRDGALGSEPAELGDVVRKVTELLVTPRYVVVDGVLTPNNGRVRKAWRGHRSITVRLVDSTQRKTAAKRAAKRAELVAASNVGKRGPARDPWNLAERSLVAAVKRSETATAAAERIEAVMRTTSYGAALTLSDGTTVSMLDVSLSTACYRDTVYPIRELARRLALATLDVD